MGPDSLPPSAQAFKEMLKAETILARMDWFEETAALSNEHPVEDQRRRLAQGYFKQVGIEPELRHALRPILEDIKAQGLRPVQDVIDDLRRRYSNGLELDGGTDSVARS